MTLIFDWNLNGSMREKTLDVAPVIITGVPAFAKEFLGEMLNIALDTDDFEIPHNAAYNVGTGSFTVCMLIKWTIGQESGQRGFFAKRTGSGIGWLVRTAPGSGKITFIIEDAGAEVITEFDTDLRVIGQFAFVLITVDRSSDIVTCYIDDVAEATTGNIAAVTGTIDNTTPVTMDYPPTTARAVVGMRGRMQIYNTVLTSGERSQLFRAVRKHLWGYAVIDGDDNP